MKTRLQGRFNDEGKDHDSVNLLNLPHALVFGFLILLLCFLVIVSVFPSKVLEEFLIAEEPLPLGDWGKRDVGEGASATLFPHHKNLPDDEGEEERKNKMKGAHCSGNDPLDGITEPVSILETLLTCLLDLRMKQKKFLKMFLS